MAGEFSVQFFVPETWFQEPDKWKGSDVDELNVIVPIEQMDGG